MKKLVLVGVVMAALSLSLSGCSGSGPAPAGTTPASASPTPSGVETDPIDVAPGEMRLPNLIGFSRDSAYMKLAQLGFAPEVIHIVEQESTQPAGTVIGMDPSPETPVGHDTSITLTVASPIAEATASPS